MAEHAEPATPTVTTVHAPRRRLPIRTIKVTVGILIVITLGFAVRRVIVDSHDISTHATNVAANDREWQLHPVLGYLHIVPGVIYYLLAPFQLSKRFRTKHYAIHRAMGRIALPAALLAGVFALVFGTFFATGGIAESLATIVFGVWFLFCLVRAFVAIRQHDMVTHRRFMIRAFAVGTAPGTSRVFIGIMVSPPLLLTSYHFAFALGFWLALVINAVVGEIWLRRTPAPTG